MAKKKVHDTRISSSSNDSAESAWRLDIPASDKQQNITFLSVYRKWMFVLIVMLAAIGGMIFTRKDISPEVIDTNEEKPTHDDLTPVYSLLDFTIPPSPHIVTTVQDRLISTNKLNKRFISGNLSYEEIYYLLQIPMITIVENSQDKKSSAKKLSMKSQFFKDTLIAGISSSSSLAQAAAISCLQHPSVNLEWLDVPPELFKKAASKVGAAISQSSGIFHAPTATLYLYGTRFPFQVVAHELAHCGSAAMGVGGKQLPFEQKLLVKAFPCDDDFFLDTVLTELQGSILDYDGIRTMSDARINQLAKEDPELNKLLIAASSFEPIFASFIKSSSYSKMREKHNIHIGTVISSESIFQSFLKPFSTTSFQGVSEEESNSYKTAALNKSFKVLFIDHLSGAQLNAVTLIGNPIGLSNATRAKLLIVEAQALVTFVTGYHEVASCSETFGYLVGSFPDDVLKLLFPKSYKKLNEMVEHVSKNLIESQEEQVSESKRGFYAR